MKLRHKGLLTLALTLSFAATATVYADNGEAPVKDERPGASVTSVSRPEPLPPVYLNPTLQWTGLDTGIEVAKSIKRAGIQARVEAREQAKAKAEAKRKRQARAEARRKREARQARIDARKAREAALVTTTDGPLGPLTFSKTTGVQGNITMAVANIPGRTSLGGWASSMVTITSTLPDFIALNEVFNRSTEDIQAKAPLYGVARGTADSSPGGPGQSVNNVVLYRSDVWTSLASGSVRVVNDDRTFHGGRRALWDRFATWTLLQRADGAVVSVISVHMPTNPGKYPRQWGTNAKTRIELYAGGMNKLRSMAKQLSAYGPVLVAGDMNSHANQGSWTAVAKMARDGYYYTKDSGVMHMFYSAPATVVETHQFKVKSDHPALYTTLAMNGSTAR